MAPQLQVVHPNTKLKKRWYTRLSNPPLLPCLCFPGPLPDFIYLAPATWGIDCSIKLMVWFGFVPYHSITLASFGKTSVPETVVREPHVPVDLGFPGWGLGGASIS